jgi:hypothetical protein
MPVVQLEVQVALATRAAAVSVFAVVFPSSVTQPVPWQGGDFNLKALRLSFKQHSPQPHPALLTVAWLAMAGLAPSV